jgi:hypothetical protein
MFGLGMPEMIIILVILCVFVLPTVFYILTIKKTLSRCAPENRTMEPGQVWLLLIPLFNMFWHFVIVLNVAKSLKKELEKRGSKLNLMPSKNIGLAMCILTPLSIIPDIGILFTLAGLVCWIIYWTKIAGFSSQIAA